MNPTVLYIDAVYPFEWLAHKQNELNLRSLDFITYRQWIIDQRIYLSDYITHHLRQQGFSCEEIIANDPLFIEKLDGYLDGKPRKKLPANGGVKNRLRKIAGSSAMDIYRYFNPTEQRRRDAVIQKAWEHYQPDIIFVREPTGIDTYFWNQFRHRSLIVGLIGCNTSHPTNWLSHNFDVLFTLTNEYQQFFKVQGIPSYLFSYGVDERITRQLSAIKEKNFDVTFVGLLGSHVQTAKTRLMESIAAKFRFNWWGPRNVDEQEYPCLYRSYMGRTSGIEMLTIYRQTKIVVNDYVDTANGNAVNLRLYEVLTTGSFLLTRAAENLEHQFGDIHSTFNSNEDCLEKIAWYLSHETERELKASAATEFALQNYSYHRQLKNAATILNKHYREKFHKENAGTIG